MAYQGRNPNSNTVQIWNGTDWKSLDNLRLQDAGSDVSLSNPSGKLGLGGTSLSLNGGTDELTWPAADGTSEQALLTDGSGALQFGTVFFPKIVAQLTPTTGPVPRTIAEFDTPAGQDYIWHISNIIGVSNTAGFEGQPTEVSVSVVVDGLPTISDQTLVICEKLGGPPGAVWFSVSRLLPLPAGRHISLVAVFSGSGYFGGDSTPSLLKYITSYDGGDFTLTAVSKTTFP